VARDAAGAILANKTIGIKISLLQTSASGTVAYSETFTPTTNQFGLFNLNIGQGTTTGNMANIDWSAGLYYIKVDMDANGGTTYTSMGTSQLLSVPYALYATNSANGAKILYHNTGIGIGVLDLTTNQDYNTAIGYATLKSNMGYNNTATGAGALQNNGIGGANCAYGVNAMLSNTTGQYNTAMGKSALLNNIGANYNVAVGASALMTTKTGGYNTAIGAHCLQNDTAAHNTAVGNVTLFNNISGSLNVALGDSALYNNVKGNKNVAVGSLALLNNSGSYNTAVGNLALYSNTTAISNTAMGASAMVYNTTGTNNCAFGQLALYNNKSGNYNIAFGSNALSTNETGSNNTALGCMADVSSNGISNATAIGYGANVHASNTVVIGDGNVTNVGSYGTWTNLSDRRLKENITYKNNLGLNFILKLKTASYNYIADTNKRRRDGLIAQDVEQALKDLVLEFSALVIDDNKDKTMNLSYAEFVIPLINTAQEQNKEIENLKAQVAELKKIVESLKK
jgi:hypothetical protein